MELTEEEAAQVIQWAIEYPVGTRPELWGYGGGFLNTSRPEKVSVEECQQYG